MVINPSAEPTSSNGEYSFDQNMVRLGIGAATVGLLLFGSLGVVAGMQEGFSSKGPIISAFACLALLGAAIHISRLSGRTLGITDDRILIKDKHGDQVCALHWVELARVTERRRMAQLALWDKPGTRRVLVDQQYEKFPLIRARILAEYAKVFALKPLPIEFQNPSSMLLETLLFGVFGVFCAFGTWSTLRQGQFGLSVCLLSFAAVCFAYLLNLYPRIARIAGPSGLYGDELVLRSLFKTEKLNRKDVSSVELQDIANPRGGTKFSFVLLSTHQGKQLRITSKFGSIPELYLTLRAWLQQ